MLINPSNPRHNRWKKIESIGLIFFLVAILMAVMALYSFGMIHNALASTAMTTMYILISIIWIISLVMGVILITISAVIKQRVKKEIFCEQMLIELVEPPRP